MPPRRPINPATLRGYRKLAGVKRPEAERVEAILSLLDVHYPDVTCALNHHSPFQLLIATVLSAQCTDEVVNQVTGPLFARYPDAATLARAKAADVEAIIRPTGFFRNKTRNIIGAAQMIDGPLQGHIPRTIPELVQIPGVARKTANVVLGTAYGLAEGVVVDTHVMRITRRWRFHDLKDPVKIERCLETVVPRTRWITFSHQVIWHGRRLCMARNPKCEPCPFLPHCPEGQSRLP
jgi:endonuclease III